MRAVLLLACLACGLTAVGASADVPLAKQGVSDYVIVVAGDAIAPEQTAAAELQSHLEHVTGAKLPIAGKGEKRIVIGPCAAFREAFPDVDLAALKHDGIVMKTKGDDIYLAGGRPRGTLYAVYTFLEDVVGCRWWSSTESFVPKKPTLRIPKLDTVYVPKLQCREAFYRDAFDGVYAARSKCNGHFEKIGPEYGGHYRLLGWCHTFYQLLPPDTYFKDHPEWYSELDGKRVAERTQLCLTNEEMRAEFVRRALEWIRKDPEAGIISISQNDWHGQCQCATCKALEEHEGSPSGPVIHFVNAVAKEIEKEFPGFLIETLAYTYTRQAPKHVKPRDNVIVRLCTIECSYAQPLATGPQNESFRKDIEAWSGIAKNLFIWNYVTNFACYIMPHPNMRVLAPNIRYFVENNTVSLFEQGDSGCSCSDFPELRAWLLAHLMWDPSRDEKVLIKEFVEGYYGPAAGPLLDYIELIHDAAEESGVFLRCYMDGTSAWFTLDQVTRANKLFDKAEKKVQDDPVLLRRVRRARMPLDHVWLNRYRELRETAEQEGKPFTGPSDPKAFAEAFVKRARDFHVGSWREGRPFDDYAVRLLHRFREPGPPPEECADLDPKDYVDIQDNEFKLFGYGKNSELVEDETASDGMAARMTTNHTQWAVQYQVSGLLAIKGKLHCRVRARCEASDKNAAAMTMGIYDSTNKRHVVQKSVKAAEAMEGYQVFDLGAHDLERGMYFWVAPCNNPEGVTSVFVDRIYCFREK